MSDRPAALQVMEMYVRDYSDKELHTGMKWDDAYVALAATFMNMENIIDELAKCAGPSALVSSNKIVRERVQKFRGEHDREENQN